jgi:hypothetical protein
MAAEAPANDQEYLLKLIKLIAEQYDLEKILDAATTFRDWPVISNDEKRDIERQSSKQSRLDYLMTLITETGRAAQFANFILRYNSPIQAAALAVLSRPTVNVARSNSEMRPAEVSTSSQMRSHCRPEKIMQQPTGDSQSVQKSSATATRSSSPMDLDTTESPEASSMDTDSKVYMITV